MNGRDSTSIENGTVRGVEVDPAHISASHSTMNGKRKPNPFNVDQSSASVRKRDRREDYAANSVPVNGNDVGVPARTPDLSSLAGIEGDIPLAKIIEHVVAHALSELKDTLGRLHTKPIEERRRVLIDYTLNTRHRFAKLLSIVRWAIDAGKIQKYQQVAEKIYNQNGLFTRAVDGLSAIYFAMPQVRMRQYDVPNAVDVLSTGSYKRMPGIIRDKFTIPPKLDTAKIREAKLAINSIICRRLLNGEPIPPPMSRYRISDGRVTFTVPSEFEIELTLLQYSVSIPWHVMSLRVTVNSAETVPESMKISLAQHQVDALRTTCQDILIAPPLQSLPPEQTTSLTVATASKGDMTHTSDPHQPLPPLSRLYDFLHTQCLSIALEMMNAQAFILSRDQWEGNIRVVMSASRDTLTIQYWSGIGSVSPFPQPADQPKVFASPAGNYMRIMLAPAPRRRPIHSTALPKSEDASTEDIIGAKERAQMQMCSKLELRTDWRCSSGLPEQWTWSSRGSSSSTSYHESDICVDSSEIDVNVLLEKATAMHCNMVIGTLRDLVLKSGLFEVSDIELVSDTHECDGPGKASHGISILRVWYRRGENAVDVSIDPRSGCLSLKQPPAELGLTADGAEMDDVLLESLALRLNKAPWRVVDLIIELRCVLALSDLDRLVVNVPGIYPLRSFASNRYPYQHCKGAPDRYAMAPLQSSSNLLPITSEDATFLTQTVAGASPDSQRLRFYVLDYADRSEHGDDPLPLHHAPKFGVRDAGPQTSWYIMVSMVDSIRLWLVQLRSQKQDPLVCTIEQVHSLSVESLFSNTNLRDRLAQEQLPGIESLSSRGTHTERACLLTQEMLQGRTRLREKHLEALVMMCQTRLALGQVQDQLVQLKIPFALRQAQIESNWTCAPLPLGSPTGADVAKGAPQTGSASSSVGRLELRECIPAIYIPISAVMDASVVDWSVMNCGVLPGERDRMIALHICPEEGTPAANGDWRKVGLYGRPFYIIAVAPTSVEFLPEAIRSLLLQRARGDSQAKVAFSRHTYASARDVVAKFLDDWCELRMLLHLSRQMFVLERVSASLKLGLRATGLAAPSLGPALHSANPTLTIQVSESIQLTITSRLHRPTPTSSSPVPELLLSLVQTTPGASSEKERRRLVAATTAIQNSQTPMYSISSHITRWLLSLEYRLNQKAELAPLLAELWQQVPRVIQNHQLHPMSQSMI